MYQQQSRLNYNRRVYTEHTGDVPEASSSSDEEVMPLDPIGHLLRKAILPRPRDIAALPNTRNKYRGAAKVRRQRNMSQLKEQDTTAEKELNKTATGNLPDAEIKTLFNKDAQ